MDFSFQGKNVHASTGGVAFVASLLDICRRQLSSAQREAFLAGLHTPPARR